MRLLGLDPGLRCTGWGLIETHGNRLSHLADGILRTDDSAPLSDRLAQIYDGLMAVIQAHRPEAAAVEETFVNKNPTSTLKLGQARGVALLAPAKAGLEVAEYAPRLIKKTVVGSGGADKEQVRMMVQTLLPGCRVAHTDAADALAVAICHAHHEGTARRLAAMEAAS